MAEEPRYTIGDPVWSKMKGYCPWPSRIAAPTESTLKNTNAEKSKVVKIWYLVYFFGSNNFAWMPEDCIKPYDEFKEKNKSGSKNASFKQGLKQIEEYVNNDGKAKLLERQRELMQQQLELEEEQHNTSAAIKSNLSVSNNDSDSSPQAVGDSYNNDTSNPDGDLPSIDEEIAAINNRKPSASSPKKKLDSHNSESLSSPTSSSVQRDYSRTPFGKTKIKISTRPNDDAAATETSPTKRAKINDYEPYTSSGLSSSQTASNATKQPTSKSGARNVLLRATQFTDVPVAERPQVNLNTITAKSKTIRPSNLKFGFLGLGFMGQRLLKNLLNSGHQVTIWNRSKDKCKQFLDAGASQVAETPADVVAASDIVFSCLASPQATKEIVFGSFGVLAEMDSKKALVDMSSIDPETSNDISEAIIARGGRYLEAPPIANGKKAAEEGDLIIVVAGERSLYEDCSSCFQSMAKQTFFLGHQVGYASKMNLILSTLYGTMVGAIAECCALVERSDLQLKSLQEILKLSVMSSPLTDYMMDKIIRQDNSVNMPLFQLQKDLRLSLGIAEECEQTCPITAITNEVFKQTKKIGYADHDISAVYLKSRF